MDTKPVETNVISLAEELWGGAVPVAEVVDAVPAVVDRHEEHATRTWAENADKRAREAGGRAELAEAQVHEMAQRIVELEYAVCELTARLRTSTEAISALEGDLKRSKWVARRADETDCAWRQRLDLPPAPVCMGSRNPITGEWDYVPGEDYCG